jgi:hypothetical protein
MNIFAVLDVSRPDLIFLVCLVFFIALIVVLIRFGRVLRRHFLAGYNDNKKNLE